MYALGHVKLIALPLPCPGLVLYSMYLPSGLVFLLVLSCFLVCDRQKPKQREKKNYRDRTLSEQKQNILELQPKQIV